MAFPASSILLLSLTNVSVNSPGTRSFIVPPLAAGDYTVRVTTQYSGTVV
ncbi:DUF4469 domain-containing protein [Breznakiellaceae bacterium SP9]